MTADRGPRPYTYTRADLRQARRVLKRPDRHSPEVVARAEEIAADDAVRLVERVLAEPGSTPSKRRIYEMIIAAAEQSGLQVEPEAVTRERLGMHGDLPIPPEVRLIGPAGTWPDPPEVRLIGPAGTWPDPPA